MAGDSRIGNPPRRGEAVLSPTPCLGRNPRFRPISSGGAIVVEARGGHDSKCSSDAQGERAKDPSHRADG